MCFKPTSLTPNPPPPKKFYARRRFHIFTIFTLIMRQAMLIAPILGPSVLDLSQQLPGILAHFYFPTRATIAATFILLTRCFCFIFSPAWFFPHFCFIFCFFFAISAGHKQKEESVESVAWRHNERKFIGSFGKIREIYCGGNSVWTFLIFLLPFSQKF